MTMAYTALPAFATLQSNLLGKTEVPLVGAQRDMSTFRATAVPVPKSARLAFTLITPRHRVKKKSSRWVQGPRQPPSVGLNHNLALVSKLLLMTTPL